MSYRSASLATTASVLLLGSSLIGAIGYFYWTSSKSRSKKANKKGQAAIPGLYNIGNTCYANALLQGLAGCPGFVTWLERIDASSLTADEESDKKEKTLFLDELKTTLLKLNDASLGTYSAANLIEALLSRKWLIAANSEQDLYELFNVFVTTWDEDLAVRASSFRTVSLLAIPTMVRLCSLCGRAVTGTRNPPSPSPSPEFHFVPVPEIPRNLILSPSPKFPFLKIQIFPHSVIIVYNFDIISL
uniref:USP domain-containing protein n=1 Tax=Plectus sambesii TaxID=2011161 RepID=A0A914VBX2_9BILA